MDKIVAFFKPPDPKTLAKQWQSQIRKEQRQLDAQVRDIERELAKTRREIKACLKRKDQKSAKVLAMHTCKARKTIEALYETKANYDSISMRLGESVGRLTQVGSVGKSSEILKVRVLCSALRVHTPPPPPSLCDFCTDLVSSSRSVSHQSFSHTTPTVDERHRERRSSVERRRRHEQRDVQNGHHRGRFRGHVSNEHTLFEHRRRRGDGCRGGRDFERDRRGSARDVAGTVGRGSEDVEGNGRGGRDVLLFRRRRWGAPVVPSPPCRTEECFELQPRTMQRTTSNRPRSALG